MKAEELCFLVAEDQDFQRRTLVGMLKRLGAKRVGDGKPALELGYRL